MKTDLWVQVMKTDLWHTFVTLSVEDEALRPPSTQNATKRYPIVL
jgi:hypothetical protein